VLPEERGVGAHLRPGREVRVREVRGRRPVSRGAHDPSALNIRCSSGNVPR
jgi:hypothetical protein